MTEQQKTAETFEVRIPATPEALLYLANLPAQPASTQIIIHMTEQQYRDMPDNCGDIREVIVVEVEHATYSEIHDSVNLESDLHELLREWNEDKADRKYQTIVDPDTFSPARTKQVMSAVAQCKDEFGRIRPWERSTSVSEALSNQGLEPDDVFRQVKTPQYAGTR